MLRHEQYVCPDPNRWVSKGYALTNGMVYVFWPLLMLLQLIWVMICEQFNKVSTQVSQRPAILAMCMNINLTIYTQCTPTTLT